MQRLNCLVSQSCQQRGHYLGVVGAGRLVIGLMYIKIALSS
jgi:hypothetical protein